MGKLRDWASEHSNYLKIDDGESVEAVYKGYETFVDKQNEDRDKIRYFFEVDGTEKTFESQSVALAEQMDEVNDGEKIIISRSGKGRQTRYDVKRVGGDDADLQVDDEVIDEIFEGKKEEKKK